MLTRKKPYDDIERVECILFKVHAGIWMPATFLFLEYFFVSLKLLTCTLVTYIVKLLFLEQSFSKQFSEV